MDKHELEPSKGQFLVYQAEDGTLKLDVRLENETVWLTQQLMAELFQTSQQNISLHIQNIYEEEELAPEATHKKYLSVRSEGTRVATRFRIWTTKQLKNALRILTPNRLNGAIHNRWKKVHKEAQKARKLSRFDLCTTICHFLVFYVHFLLCPFSKKRLKNRRDSPRENTRIAKKSFAFFALFCGKKNPCPSEFFCGSILLPPLTHSNL